jgi:hypothetical protein
MHIDENPLFRKAIVPWYDSEAACLVTVVLMEMVYIFGVAGLAVVRDTPGFYRYIWLPVVLIVLSFAVVLSITFRLIRRYTHRRKIRRRHADFVSVERR